MREIKFRAWDGYKMYEVRSLHNIHSQVNIHADLCDDEGGFGTDKPAVKEGVHDLILLQYTGLKDKNGKEVYEGDICNRFNSIGVVEWDQYEARFRIYMDNAKPIPCNYPVDISLKVIGNFYANPELLEGDSK